MVFQNLAKIDDFSNFGNWGRELEKNLLHINSLTIIFQILAKNDDFPKFNQN